LFSGPIHNFEADKIYFVEDINKTLTNSGNRVQAKLLQRRGSSAEPPFQNHCKVSNLVRFRFHDKLSKTILVSLSMLHFVFQTFLLAASQD
jgi:hypothetical protein